MNLRTKIAFLFLGFGLLACEPSERQGEELVCDYTPDRLSLVVVLYDDISEVEAAYREYIRSRGGSVDKDAQRDGFCILRSDNHRICHLPRLRGQRDDTLMLLWGHEFSHVVCGDWHDNDFEWQK